MSTGRRHTAEPAYRIDPTTTVVGAAVKVRIHCPDPATVELVIAALTTPEATR